MLRKSIIIIIAILITMLFNTKNRDIIESTNRYYGYLIIPRINMNLGFYNPDNRLNDVNYNIEFIPTNIKDTYLIAGHSGTGKVSFFNDLRYLEVNDKVELIIAGEKKEYKIEKIWKNKKNGKLKIDNKSGYLYLTTCDQVEKGYQLIIKCS